MTHMLLKCFPPFSEFREPFVGGGSVFLATRRQRSDAQFWINDLNTALYQFWKELQANPKGLINGIQCLKDGSRTGREVFSQLKQLNTTTELEAAIRYFFLNRTSFSGLTEPGGYSEDAFQYRFTQSSINRLAMVSPHLEHVRITHFDYEAVVDAPGNDVFIFLDPPYYSARKSKLYGVNGALHTSFDHNRFAKIMQACRHRWLLTYDDCEEVRHLFQFAQIQPIQVQYGMTNVKQQSLKKGRELIITNYELPPHA